MKKTKQTELLLRGRFDKSSAVPVSVQKPHNPEEKSTISQCFSLELIPGQEKQHTLRK